MYECEALNNLVVIQWVNAPNHICQHHCKCKTWPIINFLNYIIAKAEGVFSLKKFSTFQNVFFGKKNLRFFIILIIFSYSLGFLKAYCFQRHHHLPKCCFIFSKELNIWISEGCDSHALWLLLIWDLGSLLKNLSSSHQLSTIVLLSF